MGIRVEKKLTDTYRVGEIKHLIRSSQDLPGSLLISNQYIDQMASQCAQDGLYFRRTASDANHLSDGMDFFQIEANYPVIQVRRDPLPIFVEVAQVDITYGSVVLQSLEFRPLHDLPGAHQDRILARCSNSHNCQAGGAAELQGLLNEWVGDDNIASGRSAGDGWGGQQDSRAA
jgi:hypothetical protein